MIAFCISRIGTLMRWVGSDARPESLERDRMSSRFWIAGGVVLLASVVAGYSLGGFAGGRFGGGVWQDLRSSDNFQSATEANESALADPSLGNINPADGGDPPLTPDQIVCKGCGPTLAERNMMGDAYATGGNDPALQEYQAQGDAADRAVAAPPPAVVATVQKGVSVSRGPAGAGQPAQPPQP
jgi:hypothetical protein